VPSKSDSCASQSTAKGRCRVSTEVSPITGQA